MHSQGCDICGSQVVPESMEDDSESAASIRVHEDYCPECKNLLRQHMTEQILYNMDEIKEAINSIEQGTEEGTYSNSLRKPAKKKVMEQSALLRELLGLDDEKHEDAFKRRNSTFIELSFTYNRNKANFPEAIENAPLINNGKTGGDNAPWKLLQDEGETASTEGHSRATLIVEIPPDSGSVRAHDMMKLEGAIDGANGDYRTNCYAKIIRSVPEWFWEADWGMNKKSDLETLDE